MIRPVWFVVPCVEGIHPRCTASEQPESSRTPGAASRASRARRERPRCPRTPSWSRNERPSSGSRPATSPGNGPRRSAPYSLRRVASWPVRPRVAWRGERGSGAAPGTRRALRSVTPDEVSPGPRRRRAGRRERRERRRVDGAGEPAQVLLAADVDHPEARQVPGPPLDVDQPAPVAVGLDERGREPAVRPWRRPARRGTSTRRRRARRRPRRTARRRAGRRASTRPSAPSRAGAACRRRPRCRR